LFVKWNISALFFIKNIAMLFRMKNIVLRTPRALGAAVKARRLELGWSQAKLADQLRVQRQWVLRLEAGSEGAEIGKVLKALTALGLTIGVGNEPVERSNQAAPTADLDDVFARLTRNEPLPPSSSRDKKRSKKTAKARR
jgi:HTH-type transcriptional regulator / antitoxin HipB